MLIWEPRGAMRNLNILHVMRAPVGGLFRHVVDLAGAQAARGHRVGIVADATTGAERAETILAALAPTLALGVVRIPMSRHLGLADLSARSGVAVLAAHMSADVVHGHGAKGGAYARLAGPRAVRAYTPHGGSLHYRRSSPPGLLYLTLERALMRRTDLFLFESTYGYEAFRERVGAPPGLVRVVHNGVSAAEFEPVFPHAECDDILFVGELRMLKGIDVLLDALAMLHAGGHPVSASIVGAGPDAATFHARSEALGLQRAVRFLGAMPARAAFGRGRVLVVPSRAESLPYVVLEAAAAGLPIIASAVGGIGEIFGEDAGALVPPADAAALARAIMDVRQAPQAAEERAVRMRERVRTAFSVDAMTDQVLAGYAAALTPAA